MRRISREERERILRHLRTLARSRKRGRTTEYPPSKRQVNDSTIIDHYARRIELTRRRRKGSISLAVPPTFSFIEDPEAAIGFINSVVAGLWERRAQINIDHSACTQLDLCAEAVLSAIAFEGRQSLGCRIGGWLPDLPELRSIILASGLPKVLGVAREEMKGFHCFPLRHGARRRERARQSSERERAATELSVYIESCFALHDWRLDADALEYLSKIVGEVIGNAEDHSGEADWWAAGYLHDSEDGSLADCHLAIFSFGSTYHQSLMQLSPSSYLRRRLTELSKQHSSKGFFAPDKWTEENLWTLYALQEGVSRFNRADKQLDTDRGQGTADMIEFFQRLGGSSPGRSSPKMCVVSGATQILFDVAYKMTRKDVGKGFTRRVLAFNAANDLEEKPDSSNVRPLKKFFPGTLISLRFFVDDMYLTQLHQTGEYSVTPTAHRA